MDEYKHKIGFLILATSNNRDDWKSIKDSYLYNLTLKSSLLTIDTEHKYIYYIGIDKNDRIFDKQNEQKEILKFQNAFKHITIEFLVYDNEKIPKGYHTLMWNVLFEKAYNDGCEYFYQCGDDIEFKTKNWINDSINMLKSKNNILARGQNAILNERDDYENIELKPGEACIFGQDAVHGSDKNESNEDRFLLAIRYISTDNKTNNNHKSATLVRGVDNYKYYDPEPVPTKDFDEKCLSFHQKLMAKQTEIFAKYKLQKYKLSFLSFIVKVPYVRYLYYLLNKKI